MSCKIVYDNNGNKIGVSENNNLFQEILNNPLTKDFDSALEIFMETYSKEIEIPRVADIKNGFYSNAEQSLLNLKDKNPKNIKGWISQLTDTQKNGGIKNVNQELEWIGLEDYLDEYVKENNPKAGNIPFSVVEDYIKSNQIEIVDVSKGGDLKPVPLTFNKLNKFDEDDYGSTISSYETIEEVYEDDEVGYQIVKTDEGYYVRDERTDNVYRDNNYENNLFSTFEEAVRVAGLHLADKNKISTEGTKYEGYQLKGGERYREILLTMPGGNTLLNKLDKELKAEGYVMASDAVYPKTIAGYADVNNYPQGVEIKDLPPVARSIAERMDRERGKDEYKSSHWDEKNIIAHVRLNEKTLPDGRKVLILNEIQSDAAQEARKAGWQKKDAKTLKEADNHAIVTIPIEAYQGGIKNTILNDYPDTQEISLIEDKTGRVVMAVPVISGSRAVTLYENNGNDFGDKFQSADTVSFQDDNEFERYFLKEFNRLNKKGVVDFTPYKNTDQWVGVAFRRILKLAVDEGYSGVALATGQQSADMYSLAKQVDYVSTDVTPMGRYINISPQTGMITVKVDDKGVVDYQSGSTSYGNFIGKPLSDIIGKDVADKILNSPDGTKLEGEDLEIGGEGMKTFYDKIVPKVVQKEAQRFDKNAKFETVDFSKQPLRVETIVDGENYEYKRVLVDYLGNIIDAQYGSRFENDQDYIDAFQDAYNNSQGVTINKDKLSLGVQPYLSLTQAIKSAVSEAVPMFNLSQTAPKLKYQTQDGKVFDNYSDALKNTQGEPLQAGVNTVSGFKELYSVSTNINIETTEGFINNMIKSDILSGESYKENGKIHFKPQGKTYEKQKINSEIAKDLFKRQFGINAVTVHADDTLTITEENKRTNVTLTDKNGEEKTVKLEDLNQPIKELEKQFSKETVADILVNKEFKNQTTKIKSTQEEFIPENELQEKLINLLKKFGIKTLSFEDYLKNYSKRNNLPISAKALVDLENKLIAFKDGIIEEDDLVEEVAHLIESSIPLEKKENVLRNIHKTKEWQQHAEEYMRIYGNEETVRKEILGKVIANSIKENFQARNTNQTEDSIINKIKEFFNEFFDRIRAYFSNDYALELKNLERQVYKNLVNETLDLNTQDTDVLFSISSASTEVHKLYSASTKLLENLREQASKTRNSVEKSLLERAERELNATTPTEGLTDEEKKIVAELENAEKLKGIASLIRVTSSQVNTIRRAIDKTQKGDHPLSQTENILFQGVKDRVLPSLSEVKATLNPLNTFEKEMIASIEDIAKEMFTMQGDISKLRKESFKKMIEKIADANEMVGDNRTTYIKYMENSIEGVQKDTDFFHAHLGSLLLARSGVLNVAGNIIERTHLQGIEYFQKPFKRLLNIPNLNQKNLDLLHQGGDSIINEIDPVKAEELELNKKVEIINKIIETRGFSFSKVTKDTDFSTYFDTLPENSIDALSLQSEFKRYWSDFTKWKYNSYFTQDFIDRKNTHTIEIAGKEISLLTIDERALRVNDEYKRQSTQIRIEAGNNITKEVQAELKKISQNRQIDSNPRASDGSLLVGIKEIYDDNLGRYIVDVDRFENGVEKDSWTKLSQREKDTAETVVGLNQISLIEQDFYKKEQKSLDELPEQFIKDLEALQTTSEKLEFLENNSYISFPDSYYEGFKTNTGLVDKLRNNGTKEATDLITNIRQQQAVINRVLRVNSIYNKPSETNFIQMNSVQKDEIKLAQIQLESLYGQARSILKNDEEIESELEAETVVNDAYTNYVKDSGKDELSFILENTTPNGVASIRGAQRIVEGGNISKAYSMYFTEDMSQQEKEEALLKYAKTKLLPYLKRTEPIGYTEAKQQLEAGTLTVEDFIKRKDLIKINPSFSYMEKLNDNINQEFIKNRDAKKEQWSKAYLDQVKNKKYYEMFDLDENGDRKPGTTKNNDLWELRKSLLEYSDLMIEYQGLTGKRNRYMMPQVRATTVERYINTNPQALVQSARDWATFRPEEQEKGTLDANGLYTVPTYYNTPLEDKRELTKNYLYAYAMWGKQASLFKARQENIGDMFVIEDVLSNSTFEKKQADATNSLKMFKSFMESNFYGVKENFSYEIKAGDRTIDVGKVLVSLNKFAKKVNLGTVLVPITNVMQGATQKFMERIIGETINPIASNAGNKMFLKYAPSDAKEAMGLESKSVGNVIGESLGIFNAVHRFEDSQYSKAGRLAMSANSKLHEIANYPIVMRGVFGILNDYRIVDGRILDFNQFKQKLNSEGFKGDVKSEWTKNELFAPDFVSAIKDGVLDFTNPEFLQRMEKKIKPRPNQTVQEYLEEKKLSISTRALAFTNRIDSQIPQSQKSVWARDAKFNFFLSHLNYLLSALPQRFKYQHFNLSESGMLQEGSWRSVAKFMGKVFSNPKNIREIYENADENQKKNIKRVLVDIGFANALAFMALLLSRYNDDEDEVGFGLAMTDVLLTRLATEQIGSTIGLPNSLYHTLDNPLMIKSKLEDWAKINDLGGTEKERNSYLKKLIPFYKDYFRFTDPLDYRRSYVHYQTNDESLFFNTAWATRVFKKDE